jgi:predicted nucleic-acid-binding protein
MYYRKATILNLEALTRLKVQYESMMLDEATREVVETLFDHITFQLNQQEERTIAAGSYIREKMAFYDTIRHLQSQVKFAQQYLPDGVQLPQLEAGSQTAENEDGEF